MTLWLEPVPFTAALLLGMLICLDAGWRLRRWQQLRHPDAVSSGTSALEGAVFALFGLLLAFTFSGAAERFDGRRDLILQEANAIGTAYLRLDLLPAPAQPELRALFRKYVESRLATYHPGADSAAIATEYRRSIELQGAIWSASLTAASSAAAPTLNLLVPALNDMFDITTTRSAATRKHPPPIIYLMLFGLAVTASLLAGYAMAGERGRPWLHMLAFAAVVAATVYVIMDLEYPRRGLIRVDASDELLTEVLRGMQ